MAAAVHTVQPAALPAAEIAAAFPKLRALDLSRMALPPADPQTVEAVGLVDVARLPLVLPGLTAVLLDGCRCACLWWCLAQIVVRKFWDNTSLEAGAQPRINPRCLPLSSCPLAFWQQHAHRAGKPS